MEIVEDDNIEPAMPLQVPTNSERMVSLSPPRAYNITCRASVGFGSQAEAWYFAHPNGTFTPISRDPLSEVYQFLPNPLDTYRWILRFKNFMSSFTGKYSCISPNINKSLIINSGKLVVVDCAFLVWYFSSCWLCTLLYNINGAIEVLCCSMFHFYYNCE